MVQTKFSIEEEQLEFLSRYRNFGYTDRGAMVRAAIDQMKQQMELQALQASADLYAELYEADLEMRELSNEAMAEWPE